MTTSSRRPTVLLSYFALRNVVPSPLPPTTARRLAAGREAGRSFRDSMRSPVFPAETSQFEELSRDIASSRPLREFARGVLDGMLYGRSSDPDVRGFVWLAEGAFALPGRRIDAELNVFWHVVGAAASHLVGEEFLAFIGERPRPRRGKTRVGVRSPPEDRFVAPWPPATSPASRRASGSPRAWAAMSTVGRGRSSTAGAGSTLQQGVGQTFAISACSTSASETRLHRS
jgi:hypothetical protein